MIKALSILIGTVVGAGIFGLPYAFSRSGFTVGIFYLLALMIVFLIVNLCYAEMVLRTKDRMEMPGYIERYLGKWGKLLIMVSLVLGIYGALTAYIIGVGEFLHAILGPVLGGNQMLWSLIFWALASLIVLKGIGIISRLEVFMALGLIFVVFFIFILTYPYINPENLKTFHPENIFFPYGIVLFALGGASAIPTMRRILKNKVGKLKLAVIIGSIIPVLIYLLFSFSVVGVSGEDTSETAIIGLARFTNGHILLIGGIFGILAMTTSFLALGYILRELWHDDYKIPLIQAWLLTILVPGILFMLGLQSFVKVIGFSGGILAGIQSILLISAYYQAKKKGDRSPEFSFNLPKPVAYSFYLIFMVGIVYQLIY
ncbi:amino acid permease [Patescibacteria group bacterium]|nr:amino acid permease [Patescibacteria group bacterium]